MDIKKTALEFYINLAKAQAVSERRFDSKLGGIGFSWFIVMYHLSREKDGKLRRVDLAEKSGLTASGVTRILLPMEKIGLVKRESNAYDGRVSDVSLTNAGKNKLIETLERIEQYFEDTIRDEKAIRMKKLSELLVEISS